jgi:hypothetical protein
LATLAVLLAGASGHAAVIDTDGFLEEPFASAPPGVTSMAWAPDASERLFLTVKNGPVRIVKDGELLDEPFAVMDPVHTNNECGVLSVAFDPAFSENQYVYFFVTVSSETQQIIRYTANGDVGVDRTIIVADLPTAGENHDGGAIGLLVWARICLRWPPRSAGRIPTAAPSKATPSTTATARTTTASGRAASAIPSPSRSSRAPSGFG